MPNFLDRLREKPPHYRKVVALSVVATVTGLIFLLWLATLLPKISSSQIGDGDSGAGTPKPISALNEQVKRLYENGADIFFRFTDFGAPIEYVQEDKLPDNIESTTEESSNSGE